MYKTGLIYIFLFWMFAILVVFSAKPVSRELIANIRGKRFKIDAATINEFSEKVKRVSGIDVGQQSILFRGKRLKLTDTFESLRVVEGDVLNVLKRKENEFKSSHRKVSPIKDRRKQLPSIPSVFKGVSESEMDALKDQFKALMDTDFFDKLLENEDQLEMVRKQLIQNIDQYENIMPGFRQTYEEIAKDPDKWKKTIIEVKEHVTRLRADMSKPERSLDKRSGKNPLPSADDSADEL